MENNDDVRNYLEKNAYDTLSISFSEPINDELDSTFGHAFIILNNREDTIGKGSSINLFAYIDDLDSLEVIKKGLTGDLVGYFDFAQAGIVMEKYSIKLQRELIVYDTVFTQEQIKKILLMLWEMRNAPIDYQFITRNCVNGAISLLDYAVGNISLRDQANGVLMPYSLIKLLKINNLVRDIRTYSPTNNQIGLELDTSKLDEYEIRKTYWTEDGWENHEVERTLPVYLPTQDQYERPHFINNNLSYLGIETDYNMTTHHLDSIKLDYRFLNADTWERVFSSPRNVKMIIGKVKFEYTSPSDFGLNELIIWNQASYNKLKFYNNRLSSEFKLAIDKDFNDFSLKPYMTVSKGLSFGISAFRNIPYDPLLVYVMAEGDVVFDYLRGNFGLHSGILYKNTKYMINLDSFYSVGNFPYDPGKQKSNRLGLISLYRLNERCIFGAKYDFLDTTLTGVIRYSYSPWGF